MNNSAAARIPRPDKAQYREKIYTRFDVDRRATTTVLMAGLTVAHDNLFTAAMKGLGFSIIALDVPDHQSLQLGKEFGNRGQCNPAYFTVGNLIKYLCFLRDKQGIPTADIITSYLFLTAGACGPCRFGAYITEYRKALRDAGFEGFRVLTLSQAKGTESLGEGGGLNITARTYLKLMQALIVGDALNALMYRIRPYETDAGETDRVIGICRKEIAHAFERRRSVWRALRRCRKRLSAISVDRSQIKPRVSVTGEFWAMTTEGDGNYHLQRFLEQEGAEVETQLLTHWFLYMLWQADYDTRRRRRLKQADGGRRGLAGVSPRRRLLKLWLARKALIGCFRIHARLLGLKDYHFTDMRRYADLAHQYYNVEARGGEGHLEAGMLIDNIENNRVHMTLSVKPFGCMPSSAVSDGVQTAVTARHPHALFLSVETSGDSAMSVQSRIQMQLFKARQLARSEFDELLVQLRLSEQAYHQRLRRRPRLQNALHRSRQTSGCTAVDLCREVMTS
jgi:predicted nucleotide-binding protein (sugar kinase/HSP70/actin superfamily)